MPELPEVETVVRGLRPRLEGRRLVRIDQRRPDLRFPLPERFGERLTGRLVRAVTRRAKYILVHLDGGEILMAHLGMSGRMVLGDARAAAAPNPHDHIVFETDAGDELRFNDARRFGMMDLVAEAELDAHRLMKDLGPEPLSNAFNGPALAERLAGKRSPIKAALLDQRVVAGLGNIYVCESLHRAGLSPRRQAHTVQGGRAERLARAVRQVLDRAVAAGGSSLRDYVRADGELGYFQHEWTVYDREDEPCRSCGQAIRRLVQSGRSTFHCSRCQR